MQIFKRAGWLLIALMMSYAAPACAGPGGETSNFPILSLSDIHFSPFASCEGRMPCPIIQSLRAAPASAWPAILAKQDTSHPQYRKETDYVLLRSALAAAKQTAEKNQVKTVFVLGDFLAHDYRRQYKKYASDYSRAEYQAFVRKTMLFLSGQLAGAFPNASVYGVVGNNDSYRGNYRFDQHGLFFSDTGQIFASLIKSPANKASLRAEFPVGGYYAVDLLPNTRFIALNTVFFSAKAKTKEVSESARRELAWLHKQLLLAKEKHQYVMIAMHIPPGVDVYATLKYRVFRMIQFWNTEYTNQFEQELREFSPELVAIFAGHLHTDWFQMLRIDNQNVIPVTGTPSISPVYGNDPGFNIYQYAPSNGKIVSFQTMDHPLGKEEGWGVKYSFCNRQQMDLAVFKKCMA